MGHCFNFRPGHLFFTPAPAEFENVIQIWRFRSGFLLINELRSGDEDSAGQRSSLEEDFLLLQSCWMFCMEINGLATTWTKSGPAWSLVTWTWRYSLWKMGISHVVNTAQGCQGCHGSYGPSVDDHDAPADDWLSFDLSPSPPLTRWRRWT